MIKIANSKKFKNELNLIFNRIINHHQDMLNRKTVFFSKNNLAVPSEWKRFYKFIYVIKNTKKHKIKEIFKYISNHPILNEVIHDKDKNNGIYLSSINNLKDTHLDAIPFYFTVKNKDGDLLCNIASTNNLFNADNFLKLDDIYVDLFRFNTRYFSNRSKLSVITFNHKYMDSIYDDIMKISPVLKNIDQLFFFNKKPSRGFKVKKYKTLDDLKQSPIYVDRTSDFKGFNKVNKNISDDYYIDVNDIYYPFVWNNYDLYLEEINIHNSDELKSLFQYARIIQKYLRNHNNSSYSRFFKLNDERGLFCGVYNPEDVSDHYFYVKIDIHDNLQHIRDLNLFLYSMVDKDSHPLGYFSNDSLVKTEYTLGNYIDNFEEVTEMQSLQQY